MSEEQAQYAAALTTQVGGNHYKDMAIQPVEYIHKNGIGYFEGCVIKYVSRWRKKNGVEDLKKARHFLDLLIEFEDQQRGGLYWPMKSTSPRSASTLPPTRPSMTCAPWLHASSPARRVNANCAASGPAAWFAGPAPHAATGTSCHE